MDTEKYVGRIAPSPTGLLHVGHAQTFAIAQRRATEHRGVLLLRVEDLDSQRCKPEILVQMLEDLAWLNLRWSNDASRPEFNQSSRTHLYRQAWKLLYEVGAVYPSPHSRKDVERCLSAPHPGESEPVFPSELRPAYMHENDGSREYPPELQNLPQPTKVNWRFRVPDGRQVTFTDGHYGEQCFTAGRDFGDFVVWSGALDAASYELAVVVDDLEMGVTEVVRGQDLLLSTARQMLLAEILAPHFGRGSGPPLRYFHCPLVLDEISGERLAKRTPSTTLRGLRAAGMTAAQLADKYYDRSLVPRDA